MVDGEGQTHEFYAPAKDGGFLVFIFGQGCALEDLQRVHDGKASVELSSWYVIIEILRKVSRRLGCGAVVHTSVYHWTASLGMSWAAMWSINSDLMRWNTPSNLCLAMAGGSWRARKGQESVGFLKVERLFHTPR